jgi:hypothetical protein
LSNGEPIVAEPTRVGVYVAIIGTIVNLDGGPELLCAIRDTLPEAIPNKIRRAYVTAMIDVALANTKLAG